MKLRRAKSEVNEGPPAFLAVGTFVADYQKAVDHYPRERSGARVLREEVSSGGAPLNILVDLARLKVGFPLHAAAKVGCDLDGQFILECCSKNGIEASQVKVVEGASTGYTDVYTVEGTGRHTCFHFSGIGDTFSRKDVRIRAVKPRMLFLGSLGALGKMDRYDSEYGRPGATQLIRDARKQGVTTVVEIAPIDRAAKLGDFTTTLAEADYLIVSDRVTEALLDEELYSESQFDPQLARKAGRKLIECGLRKAVVIQCGTGAVYVGSDDSFVYQPGFILPWDLRVGSAGVDHAFGAGFLEGLFNGKPTEVCLRQGLAVSTVCRRHITPSESITSLAECLEFCGGLGLSAA